jgi:hypothetical protein
MQMDPKGNRLTFATAHKDISVPFASCRKVSDSRMQYILFLRIFSILHAVSNTLWLFAKRRPTTFRTETKGNPVTISNNVTQVILFIGILNSSLLVTLSVKSAKGIMFHKLKNKLLV